MKRLAALLAAAALGGCALTGTQPAPPKLAAAPQPAAADTVIERVPYRVGVSSATVEQLARAHACSGQGAGLVTAPGPVEVYRLQCADGKVFMARCELRQCRKM